MAQQKENQLLDACFWGRLDLAAQLLSTPSTVSPSTAAAFPTLNVNYGDPKSSGWTPLILACALGHARIAALLLAHPAIDPTRPDHDGWSPLLHACAAGHIEMASPVTAGGPKPSNLECAELLLAHGVEVDFDARWESPTTGEEKTIVEWAEEMGHDEIARLLENFQYNRAKLRKGLRIKHGLEAHPAKLEVDLSSRKQTESTTVRIDQPGRAQAQAHKSFQVARKLPFGLQIVI